MHKITVAFVLLVAAAALAQERPNVSPGTKFPVEGQYKPSPQSDPTRVIALVPIVPVPGTKALRAPLFLEDLESPEKPASERVKADSSKAQVPSGIVAFRAMVNEDDEWALVDIRARDAAALRHIRESQDTRVRIFTTAELASPESQRGVALPEGLSLAAFMSK